MEAWINYFIHNFILRHNMCKVKKNIYICLNSKTDTDLKRAKLILLIAGCVFFTQTLTVFATPKVTNTKSKNQVAANSGILLERGITAFNNYEFDEAADLFSQYRRSNGAKPEVAEEWEEKVNIASNAFDRVQQIVVLDSITIPRASFYKAIKLAASAGRIGRPADFKTNVKVNNTEVSFLNEDSDYLITAEENEDGELTLVEYRKLLDGSWEKLEALEGDFEKEGDYAFPFLSADGQTLYFANNGPGSMGGYDLFIAQKEPITGESLQPLNLGMPFNSPYDDIMMAIDEENGVGWWATDRNEPGGDLTVYVYIIDEIRKNYPSDTDNLEEYAKISNYKATWQEGKETEYRKILSKLK